MNTSITQTNSTKSNIDAVEELYKQGISKKYFGLNPHLVTDLMIDGKLSGSALIVYVVMVRTAGQKSTCYKSVRTLAKECHLSIPTVIKATKELLKARPELGGLSLITRVEGSTKKSFEYQITQSSEFWSHNHANTKARKPKPKKAQQSQVLPRIDRSIPDNDSDQFGITVRSIPDNDSDQFPVTEEEYVKKNTLRENSFKRVRLSSLENENFENIKGEKASIDNFNDALDLVAVDTEHGCSQPTDAKRPTACVLSDATIDQNNPDHVLDFIEDDFDEITEAICAGVYFDHVENVNAVAVNSHHVSNDVAVADHGDHVSIDDGAAVDSLAGDRTRWNPVANGLLDQVGDVIAYRRVDENGNHVASPFDDVATTWKNVTIGEVIDACR